jgi:hypothetical protein
MNNNGKARSESHCCTKSGVDITNTPGKKAFRDYNSTHPWQTQGKWRRQH